MIHPEVTPEPVRSLTTPITIAHRAGNSLAALHRAEAFGVSFVEADIWLYHDQLEVRHEKTAGPVPLLWDRWSLQSARTPRLHLESLIAASSNQSRLMLDLKGWNPQISARALATVERHSPHRQYAVSSQSWDYLVPFRRDPMAIIMIAVGNRRQLQRLPTAIDRISPHAISINARLLDQSIVRSLHDLAERIIPWGVRSASHACQLLEWGVDGINADDLEILRLTATWESPQLHQTESSESYAELD